MQKQGIVIEYNENDKVGCILSDDNYYMFLHEDIYKPYINKNLFNETTDIKENDIHKGDYVTFLPQEELNNINFARLVRKDVMDKEKSR